MRKIRRKLTRKGGGRKVKNKVEEAKKRGRKQERKLGKGSPREGNLVQKKRGRQGTKRGC